MGVGGADGDEPRLALVHAAADDDADRLERRASFAQIMLGVWFWFLWVATPALQIPLLVFMLLFTLAKKMFCPFFVFLIWFIIAASSG